MRISDWSSDVCSSDLIGDLCRHQGTDCHRRRDGRYVREEEDEEMSGEKRHAERDQRGRSHQGDQDIGRRGRESQTEGEARNGRHDEQQRQAAARDLEHGKGELLGESGKNGRASGRERVCKYVWIRLVAVSLKKKKNKRNDAKRIR